VFHFFTAEIAEDAESVTDRITGTQKETGNRRQETGKNGQRVTEHPSGVVILNEQVK